MIDHNKVCNLYKQGTDISTISKDFNVSDSTIRRVLIKNNIKTERILRSEGYIKTILNHNNEILDMYVIKRITIEKISKFFRVPKLMILKLLKKNNIKIRSYSEDFKLDFTLEEQEKICELYLSGLNPKEVSLELNISSFSIKRILRENNVRIRGNHETTSKITPEIEKQICGLYKMEKLSIFNLGKKFGVSNGFISDVLIKNNVHIRPQGKVTERGKQNIIKSNQKRCGKLSATYGMIPPKEHCWGKGDWYDSYLQGKIWIRSQWEILYAKFLDSHNILWTYETIAFPLILNNRETTYRPDFYLIDYDIYIDVKGRPEWNADKIKVFREQYTEVKLQVLFKKDLEEWGMNVRKLIIK